MRTKLIALALAVMLATGTGGVLAAGTSSDTSAEQLPDDYTVEVTDPFDDLSATDVDEAIAAAWSHEQVRGALDVTDDVHFEVVGGPDQIEVHVRPGPDAETTVVAEISPAGTVVDVFEPEVSTEDAESVSLVGPFDPAEERFATGGTESVDEPAADQSGEEYDEKLSADQSTTTQVDSDEITVVEDGERVSFEDVEESLVDSLEDVGDLVADGTHPTPFNVTATT